MWKHETCSRQSVHLFQVFHIATNNEKNTFIFDLDGYNHRRYKKIAHGREMYRHVRAVYSIREKVEKKKKKISVNIDLY